jgi:titin
MINTMSSGNLIGTDGDGIADAAERNIISGNAVGLIGSAGIAINGDDNIVAGNYIGTDATGNTGLGNLQDGISLGGGASGNLIGTDGDGVADGIEGNLISGNGRIGIWLIGAYTNTVAGNLIGTNISGTAAIPNMHAINEGYGAVHLSAGASGNVIGTNSDGANDAGEGNLISGNAKRGIAIRGATTHFNIIAGNKIGTDISGSSALGNQLGIDISDDAYLNQIGTDGDGNSDIAERNLISANGGPGIYVRGSQNQIAGNFIGTDYFGTADLGNGTHGISIADTSTENTIGGSIQKANLIAFNGKDGIQVSGMNADKTLISHNSIHSNDESGIDLTDGQGLWFSPNDPGDIDLGPNDMMNFPVLDSASSLSALLTIYGQIVDGLPNTNFEIQFFVNDVCDSPAGYGEGKTFIGSTNQITDGSGNVSFISSFASGVTAGKFITATATTDDKTSEFSACVEVADVQTYSQELEDDRCGQFDQEEMTLVTFPVDPELLVLNLYVKKPSEYPGQSPDEPEEWVYTAFLGDIEARNCNFQGFADRLYCNFIIPENFIKTSQELKVFVNLCTPPIYINKNVSIFLYEPPSKEEPDCSSDMGERECIAAGGTYTCRVTCSCNCP